MAVDPAALQVMGLSSELLREQDRVRRLRKQLWALMVVVHSERAVNRALLDLPDELLTAEPGDGYH